MKTHECLAEGCRVQVPAKMLMCRRHWFMVPRPIQAQVWATYRPGQESGGPLSDDWLDAARAAVSAVSAKEAAK